MTSTFVCRIPFSKNIRLSNVKYILFNCQIVFDCQMTIDLGLMVCQNIWSVNDFVQVLQLINDVMITFRRFSWSLHHLFDIYWFLIILLNLKIVGVLFNFGLKIDVVGSCAFIVCICVQYCILCICYTFNSWGNRIFKGKKNY